MSLKDELVGNSRRNLVLKTAGNIRVLVGDKYYNLNFRSDEEEQEDKNEEITSNFIIAKNINGYKNGIIDYPGDGKVIFTLDGDIYYTNKYKYNEYGIGESAENIAVIKDFVETVNFNATIPFTVKNKSLISNLNAQYLNGRTSDDFIVKDYNITLNNLTVKNISSEDGKFSYEDGILTMPDHDIDSINKATIGDAKINSVRELEYSTVLPYKNNLLFDVLDAIWGIEDVDFTLVNDLLQIVNSTDLNLSLLAGKSKDTQYEALSKLDNIYFTPKESDKWNEYDSLKAILNRYVDIDKLTDKKASFELSVTNSSSFSVYQTFTATIEREAYKKDDAITYDSSIVDDTYESIIETNDINCIITNISDGSISITTDYESKLFLNQEEHNESGEFLGAVYTFKVLGEPVETSDNYNDYNNLTDFRIVNFNIKSGVVGNLSGEVFDNIELSGYGIMLNDNAYFANPYIRNEMSYMALNSAYTLEVPEIRDYSILSNGYVVSLPESKLNGLVINIYANDYISLDNGDSIQQGDYVSYRLIPISDDNYKWVRI